MIELKYNQKHISTNQMYMITGRRLILTKRGRDFKESISVQTKEQYTGDPLTGQLDVMIELHRKGNRRYDCDNIKSLLDSLNKIVYQDDSQITRLTIEKFSATTDMILIKIKKYNIA